MMVNNDALAYNISSARRIHFATPRPNEEVRGARAGDGRTDGLHFGPIEPVGQQDRDAARGDGGCLRQVVHLGERARFIAVVGARRRVWNYASDVDGNCFRQLKINVVENFGV